MRAMSCARPALVVAEEKRSSGPSEFGQACFTNCARVLNVSKAWYAADPGRKPRSPNGLV